MGRRRLGGDSRVYPREQWQSDHCCETPAHAHIKKIPLNACLTVWRPAMVDPDYTAIELPEIVRKANALADALRFPLMPEGRPLGYDGPPSACIPQVGRLLQTLAAGKPRGLIGELGTGAGVGHSLACQWTCG